MGPWSSILDSGSLGVYSHELENGIGVWGIFIYTARTPKAPSAGGFGQSAWPTLDNLELRTAWEFFYVFVFCDSFFVLLCVSTFSLCFTTTKPYIDIQHRPSCTRLQSRSSTALFRLCNFLKLPQILLL